MFPIILCSECGHDLNDHKPRLEYDYDEQPWLDKDIVSCLECPNEMCELSTSARAEIAPVESP